MKIAHLANLYLQVPPADYGGTQRTVAQMAAFQAATLAYEVTVYAPADSKLVDFTQEIAEGLGLAIEVMPDQETIRILNEDGRVGSVRLRHTGINSIGYTDPDEVRKNHDLVDILIEDDGSLPYDKIHSHYPGLTVEKLIPAGLLPKVLTHQHSNGLAKGYKDTPFPLICISESHARFFREEKGAEVEAVVYHGMDTSRSHLVENDSGYLVWIGRFLDEKGAHRAIEVAKRAGKPLIMAGTIYDQKPESQKYFDSQISPNIEHQDFTILDNMEKMDTGAIKAMLAEISLKEGTSAPIIFAGPANDRQKQTLFGNGLVTLFLISWQEPFGLVPPEGMATGTPSISAKSLGDIDCGAASEVIQDGETGYTFDAVDEEDYIQKTLVAIEKISDLSRARVRSIYERDWSAQRMVADLHSVYQKHTAKNASLAVTNHIDVPLVSGIRSEALYLFETMAGLGHQRRASGIVNALIQANYNVSVASGTFVNPDEFFDSKTNLIRLKEPRRRINGVYHYYDTNSQFVVDKKYNLEDWKAEREKQIHDYASSRKIDVLMAEWWPFERRNEFSGIIDTIMKIQNAIYGHRPIVISSIRDVLTNLHQERLPHIIANENEALATIDQKVDHIIMHGDPNFVSLAEAFARHAEVRKPIEYTGYVVNESAKVGFLSPREETVIVSCGSGEHGHHLLKAALRARPYTDIRDHEWIYVIGPRMAPEHREEFLKLASKFRRAAEGQYKEQIHDQISDLPLVFAHAGFSISYGGYNTTSEVLASRVPSVIVPKIRVADHELDETRFDLEQWDRLVKLEAAQMASAAHPALTRNPKAFAAIINASFQRGSPSVGLDMNGAQNTAMIVTRLLGEKSLPSLNSIEELKLA